MDSLTNCVRQSYNHDDKTPSQYETTHAGTCVQVSAGNQLFHILVDTDDIAARLSAMLKKEQAGRVTFIPLNQVRAQNVTYPNVGDDALPLVKKLKFDARFKDAVHQVRPLSLPYINVISGSFQGRRTPDAPLFSSLYRCISGHCQCCMSIMGEFEFLTAATASN